MTAISALNKRVKDPLYHFVISWKEGEVPDRAEAFGSVEHTLKNLGFEGHQFVAAIHRDTDNAHVHVMVNRVNPGSLKVVTPANDYYVLDRCMRELEIRYSRSHAKGPYVVVERHGRKVVERAKATGNGKQPREPDGAERMRVYAGTESFHAYLREDPRRALVTALKNPGLTWPALHAVCAQYGIDLREKGQGLAFYAAGDDDVTPIKASDVHENLSLARLTKRLGPYEAATAQADEPDRQVSTYDSVGEAASVAARQPVSKRDPALRMERREARAQARRDLKLRYASYKNGFSAKRVDPNDAKQRYAQLTEAGRLRRAGIRAGGGRAKDRKMLYSLLALEQAKKREQLVAQLATERKALREAPGNRPLSYREWVAAQAQAGDEAAVAQLRGWAYADGRMGNDAARLLVDERASGIAGASDAQPVAVIVLSHVAAHDVRRDGSIVYWHQNRRSFVDYGRAIRMVNDRENSEDRIHAALLLARQKFGSSFKLTGTDDFKEQAIQLLVKHGIAVTLKDPEQEARRQLLLSEIRGATSRRTGAAPRGPAS